MTPPTSLLTSSLSWSPQPTLNIERSTLNTYQHRNNSRQLSNAIVQLNKANTRIQMTQHAPIDELAAELSTLCIRYVGNDDSDSSQDDEARTTNVASSANLSMLPNELLHQIVGYLTPIEGIAREDGCELSAEDLYAGLKPDPCRRRARATQLGVLSDLALTCKRLLPVVQEALYLSVSLPQPQYGLSSNTRHHSPLTNFLYTVIGRPDLAARVQKIAVWLWKGKAVDQERLVNAKHDVCGCGECAQTLSTAVANLRLMESETAKWAEYLLHPTEAIVCSLVFAALPNLKSVLQIGRAHV